MDLQQITDLKELKAMAYDQIAMKEQAEANLNALNNRITQIVMTPPAEDEAAKTEDCPKGDEQPIQDGGDVDPNGEDDTPTEPQQ